MNRARVLAAVLIGIGATLPTLAPAQNLEAGKSPGQLFTNTCTACHRSPRGLLRTVPPGSLPSFLREHYTTSRDMAQQLAGFLISNGATDTRGRPQEARQQPAGAEPPRPNEPEQARPQRPIEQGQAARPPEPPPSVRLDPREEARQARRERRARREAEQKRLREAAPAAAGPPDRRQKNQIVTPAVIDATAARGKDALPLGAVIPPPVGDVATPNASTPTESAKPAAASSGDTPSRSDPVPQVTPAAPASAKVDGPSESPPREAAAPSQGTDEPPSGSTGPAESMTPAPPSSSGPPPAPPISN